MAPQLDRLTRIGYEGFGLIEECYGGRGRTGAGRHQYSNSQHHQNHQPPQLCIYHGPQISTVKMPVVVNVSNEVAQRYGSLIAKEANSVTMTSDEAAECYGGTVIMEYGRRKYFCKA